ncbi:MAG: hypothetical protein SF187_12490 [Deltaproteobacteria bacterium]|nr:hypothetical protein [Deltaproteobacteria bacterium]
MCRQKWVSANSIGLVAALVASWGATAFARPPKLTSTETNVAHCPAKEPGAPRHCPAQAGFSVIETKTDMSDFRLVVREETGFQIFLEPANCPEARFDGPLVWRRFDDEPFAVIQSVKCSDPEAATVKGKAAKARSVVVVRGLAGFEDLKQELDAAKHKNAVKEATEAADRYLKGKWPKIEEARVAAAEAATKDESKEDHAEPAPEPTKVIPASESRRK